MMTRKQGSCSANTLPGLTELLGSLMLHVAVGYSLGGLADLTIIQSLGATSYADWPGPNGIVSTRAA